MRALSLLRRVLLLGRHSGPAAPAPIPSGTPEQIETWLRSINGQAAFAPVPQSQWDLTEKLSCWLHQLHQAVPPCALPPRRLLIISVMPHWNYYCVPLAVALAGRGARVDYVFLPYENMGAADPGEQPEAVPQSRSCPFVSLHPRLRFSNLLSFNPSPVTADMRPIADRYAEKDARYVTFREQIDFESDRHARQVRELRRVRNLKALQHLETVLRQNRYDSVLIPNGAIYEFGAAFDFCRLRGLGCVTIDFTDRKRLVVASKGEPAPYMDATEQWERDRPHVLTPEREQRVRERLNWRERPNWQEGEYTWIGQFAAAEEESELTARLGLDPSKPTALLCTNLAWDSAVLGRTRTFGSMCEWIVETIGWFKRRPDWQLIVRTHPAEAIFPTNQPVAALVQQAHPELPGHIRLVNPSDPINTYGLMRFARLGLVYTTTAGMEMAARGIPVIVAGQVHYAGKGFTYDPTSPAEYFATLEQATASARPKPTSPDQVRLALCYADIWYRFPMPFPWWDMANLAELTADCPVESLLRQSCPAEYLATLDFLAGLTR